MLPMRAIFEAFDAEVLWNQKTSTVTAIRDDITIVLKIGAQTATVNNQKVALDVPAQNLYGTTMVPVRFVSETLGAQVLWNQATQTVSILTSDTNVNAVSYVSARIVGRNGDGRDLEVSFPKVQRESNISEYRVLVVKSANAYGFNLSQAISTGHYTSVQPSGIDPLVTLSSQSRDVNGDVLKNNQSYSVYVLSVGKRGSNALSGVSQSVTLSSASPVSSVSNVKASDVNDYGDGRDLSVSFNQPQNTSNIQNYRVMVVKTKDAGSFNLNTASALASSNYTTVSKTSSTTVTTTLSSSTRDTSGEYIKNGVSYTVFVLSVASGSNTTNQLSSASASFTLTASVIGAPVITKVEDVSNYGDGRDLMVRFNKSSDESRVGSYRIFVVKDSKADSFNLSTATSVSSSYYSVVSKTGYNINQTLSSGARDVDGSLINPGVVYRVFVMAVGTGSYSGNYALSAPSSSIVLYGNTDVNAATNVSVSDVSDYGDGRDLRVSFTRASDESNLYGYRIMVVKASDANYFDLSSANAVSSSNYTSVSKTGYNITQTLSSGARDVDGQIIRNGVSYRVFVLSVGSYSTNALSSYSPVISLSANSSVYPATSVGVSDVADNGDGRDLRVTFTRANNESNISEYRIMVVQDSDAYYFDLSTANAVSSSYYTRVSKTGNNINQTLSSGARDVSGKLIQNGVKYRVFVLSVASSGYYGNNALSSSSSAITLSGNSSVAPATSVTVSDVSDFGDGRDLRVSFTRAADESNLSGYRIMVVKASDVSNFNVTKANAVSSSNYTSVSKTGSNITQTLAQGANDVDGKPIQSGISYRVFVLSVGAYGTNALSTYSSPITLSENATVPKATNVTVSDVADNGDGRDLQVSFTRANGEQNIKEYRIMVVKASDASYFNLTDANAVSRENYTAVSKTGSDITLKLSADSKDINGGFIKSGVDYQVFVLSVGTTSDVNNALSSASPVISLSQSYSVGPAKNVSVKDIGDNNNGSDLQVSFTRADNDNDIKEYRIMVVKSSATGSFNEKVAANLTSSYSNVTNDKKDSYEVILDGKAIDTDGAQISNGFSYKVYVLSVGNHNNYALSPASGPITLDTPVPDPVVPVNPVTNLVASDAGDEHNGKDMKISFTPAVDEKGIGEYRIFFVSGGTNLTVDNALKVASDSYTSVTAGGKEYNQAMSDTTKDTGGKALTEETPYKIYVLSVATKGKSVLSEPANVTLIDKTTVPTNITAKWNNGAIDVAFKKPANASQVQKYVVMVVPTTLKDFSLKTAAVKSKSDSNMKTVKVDEDYTVTFTAEDKDVNGKRLSDKNSYNIYILSIGDKKSVLSDPIPVTVAKTDSEAADVQGKKQPIKP
nr:copper amine oxidase N-terminal domain-containing protein [Paenibacillus mangrovi]